jgi:hypothetical protein
MANVPGVNPCIRGIIGKYLIPQQPPLPSGNSIVCTSFYKMLVAKNKKEAWRILCAMLNPAFLQLLLRDPYVPPHIKKGATLLLLVIASDFICSITSDEAKEILAKLEVVPFDREHYPYTHKIDAILQEMDIEASMSSENHKCDRCVAVPTVGDIADGSSCIKYDCQECLHFTHGRDTVHTAEGTHACSVMQQIMAWANMFRLLVPLARVVANSSEYRHVSEQFTQYLDAWRCSYGFRAFPMLFTAKRSIRYLRDALGLFENHTSCPNVLWRHVSLLLHMQQVLQMKVSTPSKGDLLDENRKTLAEFQEKYGRFLPPLPSPPLSSPPLSLLSQ